MTYGLFLIIFIVIPIGILGWMLRHDLTRRHLVWIGGLMAIALIYTTPWDNYLVATRVWWYDPERVSGVRFGWVPLEEYLFFLLQPILTGLWVLGLNRWFAAPPASVENRPIVRWISVSVVGLIWVASLIVLLSGWEPATYLVLILVWALPPIMLQLFVGADVLWARRGSVLLALATATLYLAGADMLAIGSGVWMISPEQTLGIDLAGILPLEELTFFLLTNTLLTFTIHLLLAWEQAPIQVVASMLPSRWQMNKTGNG